MWRNGESKEWKSEGVSILDDTDNNCDYVKDKFLLNLFIFLKKDYKSLTS